MINEQKKEDGSTSRMIYYSKSIPLQWNEFKGTHIEFRNQLLILTSKFTEDWINDKNSYRLELIFNLHKRGLSNREITNYLILLGIKKRNTRTNYTVKDVYMCIKKLKLREERLNKIEYVLGEWVVNYFTPK